MQISISILVANATSGISYVKRLVKNFKARVLSYPNSIFEAEPCLVATLTELNNIELLRQSSLVITPNAYNEGVLYDVIPNTTLGDMDVVRATTATRVNSSGLIEVVPRNLLGYSNDFTNGVWTLDGNGVGQSVTPNYAISPDGTQNASRLQLNKTGGTFSRIFQTGVFVSGINTISVYMKSNTNLSQNVGLRMASNGINCLVTTSWQRFTLTSNETSSQCQILLFDSIVGNDEICDILIYACQSESFPTATEYFPTTTRLNIPRIDYTNGSCPSLLVEPQRTNLALRSEEFSNVSWEKGTPITLVSNTTETTSPQGINNATKATANGTGLIFIRQAVFSGTTSPTTNSIFVKKANNRYVGFRNGGSGVLHDVFDFNTETWTNNSGSTLSFDRLTNGWYRLKSSRTNTLPNTYISVTIPDNTSGAELTTVSNLTLYLWGGQSELNVLYATSYIPTVASTVTRNADVISKTGISSLIGQTEGTLFFEGRFLSSVNFDFDLRLSDGTANNYITLFNVGLKPTVSIGRSGSVVFNTASLLSNFVVGQNTKIAITYKNNSFNVYQNGVLKANQNSGSIPLNLQNISISDGFRTASINSVQLYKTELTSTECIALTTL